MQVRDSARRRARPEAPVDISIVVPAFNEELRLPRLIDALTDDVGPDEAEIVVVDDGSADATVAVALDLLDRHEWNGRVASFPTNEGKGAAVRAGTGLARGRAVIVMDADLATDLDAFGPAVDALRAHQLAVGVRDRVDHGRAAHRRLMTSAFGLWVRLTTRVEVTDTQCGFKAYRAPIAGLLLSTVRSDGFAQDAEALDLAGRLGLRVAQVPVRWTAVPGSKVRAVRDSLRTASELGRYRLARNRSVHLPALRVSSASLTTEELTAAIAARVRRTDLVCPDADAVLVLTFDAPEVAHRRIAERLATAAPDIGCTHVTISVGRLFGRLG